MTAYVYDSELHCKDCIDKIKAILDIVEPINNLDSGDYPKEAHLNSEGDCSSCGLELNPRVASEHGSITYFYLAVVAGVVALLAGVYQYIGSF